MIARSRLRPLALSLLFIPFLGGCASGGAGAGPHKEILVPGGGERPLFSTIVQSGGILYLSGVVGRSPTGDAAEATRAAMDGIQQRLARIDHTMDDLVKCVVYLIDMDDYAAMNEVYVSYFPSNPPARTAVAVRALPVNAQVEVDCIAAARR
jgi:enamine deaminase RidA (YjgF/YER057c/UK114 family)